MASSVSNQVVIRTIRRGDARVIAAIDAAHTGVLKRAWWEDVVARHTRASAGGGARVGLVAVDPASDKVIGYLLAQVRAFEFGSEPCGWVFAVGVHQDHLRAQIATQLLARARTRFRELGVSIVRTMVRRDDVPVLTFFRSQGFAAGPYQELELKLPEVTP
ncbi:MAG: GNAT family N-acetyltransferase [Planctomycetota bacterium]